MQGKQRHIYTESSIVTGHFKNIIHGKQYHI